LKSFDENLAFKDSIQSLKTVGTWDETYASSFEKSMAPGEKIMADKKAALAANKFVKMGDIDEIGKKRKEAASAKKAPAKKSQVGIAKGSLGQVKPNLGRTNIKRASLLSGG